MKLTTFHIRTAPCRCWHNAPRFQTRYSARIMSQQGISQVTRKTIYEKCSMFKDGQPCPYATSAIKDLVNGCPEFKNGKCAFRDIKDIGELKTKLAQMRETCPSKKNFTKAMELAQEIYDKQSKTVGQCPMFKHGSPLATDTNGDAILTYAYISRTDIESKCPMFKAGQPCPYATNKIKDFVRDCPEFKDCKCAFRDIKDVGEFKTKLGQMRETCKGKAGYTKALEEAQKIYEANSKKVGQCPLFKFGSPLETDIHGKAVLG